MASSSSSYYANDPEGGKFDVFISFRGSDVRSGFISHLLVALKNKQIKAFIDEDIYLRRGELITSLFKVIESSYISFVFFSKEYPNSQWCLEELEKILECMKTKKQIVLPIFYGVDPSDVRFMKGNYSLKSHAGTVPQVKIDNWKRALIEITNLSGFSTDQYRMESKLCDAIANYVTEKLNAISLYDRDGLFGTDERVKEVESLIEMGLNSVSMIVIWGIAGVGKTTLADKVFHRIKKEFDSFCFVENIREILSTNCAAIDLKHEIIKKLLMDETRNLNSSHIIDDSIRTRLFHKKVLIVLDDVDTSMELNSLLEDSDLYSVGSKIIVTSRNKQVADGVNMEKIMYEVKQLEDFQALQLFSYHAFGSVYPQEEYKKLSEKIVKYALGIPLVLKILGAELRGRPIDYWVCTLEKLSNRIPHRDILKVFRTSFDGLDWNEKSMFLDIACFFEGGEIKDVERILQCFDFYQSNGINRLCYKSLITIRDPEGTIEMHDLLHQMAQEIVVEESKGRRENQSRLWKSEDIKYVLETNRETENVEGISLNVGEIVDCINISSKAFIDMHKLRFLRVFGYHDDNGNEVNLPEGLCFLPNSLGYLYWEYFPLSRLPSIFSLENLVELDMPHSNLEQLTWEKPPKNLKRICLSYSKHLIKISDLAEALNLEVIELLDCPSLTEIGSSLAKLSKLTELNLGGCPSLYLLPEIPLGVENLYLGKEWGSLQTLDFSECSNLRSIPNSIFNLRSLRSVRFFKCENLNKLPEHLGDLEYLVTLDVSFCGLKELPSSICNLRSLKNLNIRYCETLDKLPEDMGNLESLKCLDASGSGLRELPCSVCNLRSLISLKISKCKNLNQLPKHLGNIESLECIDASGSGLVELPSSIEHLSELRCLNLSDCKKLKSLPVLPLDLEELYAANCTSLESLSNTFQLPFESLILSCCDRLNESSSSIIWKQLLELQYLSDDTCPFICLVGSEVPQWMKYLSDSDSSLSLELDTPGHSIRVIFCVVLVAGDICRLNFHPMASLTDDCGNKIEFKFQNIVCEDYPLTNDLEHMLLWDGLVHCNVREASFQICYQNEQNKEDGDGLIRIKSIGFHPMPV